MTATTLADEIAALGSVIQFLEMVEGECHPKFRKHFDITFETVRSALARLEAIPVMISVLKTIEKVLVEDTSAEEHPCCGWGPLLAEVRSILPPEPQEGGQ